jgi:hypothetical protein
MITTRAISHTLPPLRDWTTVVRSTRGSVDAGFGLNGSLGLGVFAINYPPWMKNINQHILTRNPRTGFTPGNENAECRAVWTWKRFQASISPRKPCNERADTSLLTGFERCKGGRRHMLRPAVTKHAAKRVAFERIHATL